jgi:RNA polymerase sigma factor (sigma-70 family)
MGEPKLVDHLFRHQYGKMVAILTKYFGLSQLEIIEDAIQDTFIKAMMTWRNQKPDNPEAWLNKVAKNRTIDLLRKNQAELIRINQIENGQSAILADDIFLDHEIEDSQLRMIFTACHPKLDLKNQIAFALKTIAGFGTKEIASALLLKEETVKKRLVRAKKTIAEESISFEIPDKKNLPERLNGLLNVIYLTF